MERTINSKTLDNGDINLKLLDVPDNCPRCHKSINPKSIVASSEHSANVAQVVFQCTSHTCLELFIGTYSRHSSGAGYIAFSLRNVAPRAPQGQVFPESVHEVSTAFVEIFNQAIAAESHGLTQLVGIGLRKALEFLLKDFAVHQHPDDAEKIRGMLLGACIDEFANDPNVKACAKRAAWLGNDETHYVRKWGDKDIGDLKLLVRLTTNWIDSVLLTQKYVAEMQPNSP